MATCVRSAEKWAHWMGKCKLQGDPEWERFISGFHPFLLGCGQIHSTVGNLQWGFFHICMLPEWRNSSRKNEEDEPK